MLNPKGIVSLGVAENFLMQKQCMEVRASSSFAIHHPHGELRIADFQYAFFSCSLPHFTIT